MSGKRKRHGSIYTIAVQAGLAFMQIRRTARRPNVAPLWSRQLDRRYVHCDLTRKS
jgi:hypothetical protein